MQKRPAYLILSLLVLTVLLVACAGASLDESLPPSRRYAEFAESLLGTPRNDEDSGMVGNGFTPATSGAPAKLAVYYQFFPTGATSLEKDIGIKLADFFRRFYDNVGPDEVGLVRVRISLPFEDEAGNIIWKRTFTLDMSHDTYTQIDWDNFNGSDLTVVADLFQRD